MEEKEDEERKEALPPRKSDVALSRLCETGATVCSEGDTTEQDVPGAVTLTPVSPPGRGEGT